MRVAAIVALGIGILMIAQWLFFLGTDQVPELETTPVAILLHLLAELLTALALVASGTGLLLRRQWAAPVALVALGMVLYTVINSAGYFAQQQEWPLVLMFALLFILALGSTRRILEGLL